MSPNLWTFLARGARQVREHGPRLLWLRYIRRKAILRTPPIPCPAGSPLEVHMQICGRDWLNAFWTLKGFSMMVRRPFHLLVLCDATVTEPDMQTLGEHFPGSRVIACARPAPKVHEAFAARCPGLFALRENGQYFTLPKIMDSYAHRTGDVVLLVDPDIIFFAHPPELLEDLTTDRGYFARLNVPRKDADHCGAFCLDAESLRAEFGLDLPLRFNSGLGSLNYQIVDWEFIERVLAKVPPVPERRFLLEQSIIALLSLHHGWQSLPTEKYVIEPVESLKGVVARHYYSKTRDLLYLEGIPRLIALGLLKNDFRFSAQPAISAG